MLFLFFIFMFSRRGCTWTVLDGGLFFVRAKTSRHFSGAPVYISFCLFGFVAIITIIICIFLIFFFFDLQREKKSVFQKEACGCEWRRMRKAFICKQIRTKPDYAEPLRWSCHLSEEPPRKHVEEETQWTEPLLKGGAKTRPSMFVFGQCAVASLHTLQRVERRGEKENGGKCLSDRSMYKVYFCFTSLWVFTLIRTQAFSVFSEASCGGPAARQNNKTNVRESEAATIWTKETARGWPPVHSSL